jgi:hypothetical protein
MRVWEIASPVRKRVFGEVSGRAGGETGAGMVRIHEQRARVAPGAPSVRTYRFGCQRIRPPSR